MASGAILAPSFLAKPASFSTVHKLVCRLGCNGSVVSVSQLRSLAIWKIGAMKVNKTPGAPTALSGEDIDQHILLIRGQKVLLDVYLAQLYGVEPRALKQAVRRNITRFPADFMFQLSEVEWSILRSQFVISSWGGQRYRPLVFTEQGVAMLSSILRSRRADRRVNRPTLLANGLRQKANEDVANGWLSPAGQTKRETGQLRWQMASRKSPLRG